MNEISNFSTKLTSFNETLRKFEEALLLVRDSQKVTTNPENLIKIQFLLEIIESIIASVESRFSKSVMIDELKIWDTIRIQSTGGTSVTKNQLLEVYKKLEKSEIALDKDDIIILNIIADAIDFECEKLFKRMMAG